jgi:A/G-specific adenine glycosylase
VAVMELGALVCTATRPDCASCPVARRCAWRRAGSPAGPARPGAQQRYEGSDRECRGRLLSVLREAAEPVSAGRLAAAWPEREQRARALRTLVADGLAEVRADSRYALPGPAPAARKLSVRGRDSSQPRTTLPET